LYVGQRVGVTARKRGNIAETASEKWYCVIDCRLVRIQLRYASVRHRWCNVVCRGGVGSACRQRSGESMWRTNAATSANHASSSDSSRTGYASRTECWSVRPNQYRTHISADSRGWFHNEFSCQEEVWLCRTRASGNARRPVDQGGDGVSRSLKPVHASSGHPAVAVRPGRQYPLL